MVRLPEFLRGYLCRPFSDYVLARSTAAGVSETFPVPADAKFVVFSSTSDFYVKKNAAAVIPVDVTDGTAAELNMIGIQIMPGTLTIGVITVASGVVTAAFYS